MMKCPLCHEYVLWERGKHLVAVDTPVYMNLIFHQKCYESILDIDQFISENFQLCYNYWREKGEKREKKVTKQAKH